MSSVLKDDLDKVKGGPCQGNNLNRHIEARANMAGRDLDKLERQGGVCARLRSLDLQVIGAINGFLWA